MPVFVFVLYRNTSTAPILHMSAIVISIRRYMQYESQPEDSVPLPMLQTLIEGIERYSVPGAPEESARFRECSRQLLSAIESHASADELQRHTASLLEAFKQHNQRAVESWQQPMAESQAKVRVLTEVISAISGSSSENIRRLQEIKGQLLSAADVREIRSLRARLFQYLDGVLAEAERQRAEADRAAEKLLCCNQRQVPPENGGPVPDLDAATGLPLREAAEEAISQACEDGTPAFVVVMVINQVATVRRSFGAQFGDLLLQRFAASIRPQLPAIDQLFRWTGPTIVALVRRRTALEVRGVIEPLLLQRLSLKTVNPDVQVPISARWSVLPLMASPRLLFHKIDSFAGIQ
jgi:GGDEF domain-containing protein